MNKEKFETIKQIKELMDQGIITREEFDAKKKQILDTVEKEEKVLSNNCNNIQTDAEKQQQPSKAPGVDVFDSNTKYTSHYAGTNAENTANLYNSYTNQETSNSTLSKKATNILSYLGIFWLLAYFAGDRANCKYHINQGLVLIIFNVIVYIVLIILRAIQASLMFTAPGLSVFVGIIAILLGIFDLVLWIMGLIYAIKDVEQPIPLIGGYVIIK